MPATENQIVVYQPNETIRLDVRLENETVWLSQEQMCELFQRDRTVITKHVRNVFSEGECDEANNVQILHINQRGRSLILIDNWATPEVLDLFAKKRAGVKVTIFTSEHYDKNHVPRHKISDADIKTFNAQYPKLAVRYNESFHDRFLIVDDRELYLIGASLKDLGCKCFGFTKMDRGEIRRIKKEAFGAEQTVE